jgi:hypothetical protein
MHCVCARICARNKFATSFFLFNFILRFEFIPLNFTHHVARAAAAAATAATTTTETAAAAAAAMRALF